MVELSQVNARGASLIGVVSALRPTYERDKHALPPELWRYFEEPLELDAWYSLEHYLALMHILAGTMDPNKAKGDVWRAFGVIGAQRDLRSVQDNVPENQRPDQAGIYEGFIHGGLGLSTLVRRGLSLRERYYSRGYYRVARTGPRKVEVTLHDFPLSKELCAVSTGYLTEVFRSAKVGAWVERLTCKDDGDADCRWEIRFAEPADVASLADFE